MSSVSRPPSAQVPVPLVRAQLDRIISSDSFVRSERLSAFLKFIVGRTLAGEGHTLKEASIAAELYGKGTDFNGAADPIVRQDARRLRDRLREYYATEPDATVVISVPKGGYTPVFVLRDARHHEPSPAGSPDGAERERTVAMLMGAVSLIGCALLLISVVRRADDSEETTMRVVPLTAFEGSEILPTFSPDGEQVAFAWDGEAEDSMYIYVKPVGSTDVRRLTAGAARECYPVWSPDGLEVAFIRYRADKGFLHVVSPVTGRERQLADFPVQGKPSWSPDGQWLAAPATLEGRQRIYLVPAKAGVPRPIAAPIFESRSTSAEYYDAPAFSPDGRRLAYVICGHMWRCRIEAIDLTPELQPAGAPRALTSQPRNITRLAWSADGKSLLYTADSVPWGFHLYRLPVDGRSPPQRIEIAGLGASGPATDRTRNRLAFTHSRNRVSVHRLGAPLGSRPVLSSALWEFHPQFSPDGRRLAFSSSRSGESVEIWLASADGTNARPLTRGPGRFQSSPAWSPDGRLLAFDSQSEAGNWSVWLVRADSGVPRRLTTRGGDENMPTWSRDGKWVYFSADLGQGRDIWRAPAAGGQPERMTFAGSGWQAFESADGRELLYKRDNGASALLARPLRGGAERQLIPCVHELTFSVTRTGIYYAECGNGPERALHLLDPATGRDRAIGTLEDLIALGDRLAVSPDGETVLVHRESRSADLMLIENFR